MNNLSYLEVAEAGLIGIFGVVRRIEDEGGGEKMRGKSVVCGSRFADVNPNQ